MQDTVIGNDCVIDAVITDKRVKISDTKILQGSMKYPIFIGKKAEI